MSLIAEVWISTSEFTAAPAPAAAAAAAAVPSADLTSIQTRRNLHGARPEPSRRPENLNHASPDDSTVINIAQDMRGLMMDVLTNIPVQKVRIVELDHETAAQCSVCHETVQIGDDVRKLPCDHTFHQSCIDVWVLQHATCPNCRRALLGGSDDAAPVVPLGPSGIDGDGDGDGVDRDRRTLRF